MVAELAACAMVLVATAAEVLHARRCRSIARLAFGPRGKAALWARWAPGLRIAALAGLTWGLVTLFIIDPKVHKGAVLPEGEIRHLVLALDVSPSMRLEDAGPTGKQSRRQRVADLLSSFFERIPMERYRTSVVAVYNGAKPVVVDTKDLEIIRNILTELPMNHAFPPGATDLFAGLAEAARIAKPWPPRSTTLVLVSDGDTVPAAGMPPLPPAVANVLVVGVGDPLAGKYIDGHLSRQDMSTLRQIATRLGGSYHNGNEKHLPSDLLRQISLVGGKSAWARLTLREYALLVTGLGAGILALLPLALHLAGTRWQPGTPRQPRTKNRAFGKPQARKRVFELAG